MGNIQYLQRNPAKTFQFFVSKIMILILDIALQILFMK